MTPLGITFTATTAVAILVLPRKWAAAPLLVGVIYFGTSQGIVIGSLNFYVIRILILSGLLRALIRNERPQKLNRVDWLMIAWFAWALMASAFRDNPAETFVANLGFAGNACGLYFLLRIYISSPADVKRIFQITSIILTPIAIEMIYEQVSTHNLFSIFGGSDHVPFRNDRWRSRGPFLHPILAGTAGATMLPVILGLWNSHRKSAIVGGISCCVMIYTSSSSGPILSMMCGLLALSMWRYRQYTRVLRWAAVFAYVGLAIVMKAPVYYLIGRIDVTGGSTGWHRAALIDSSIRHLSEWWLAGTDYTRHWMPTGVEWSQDHTDITNHYLALGVDGGLLLTALFIAIIWKSFAMVGEAVHRSEGSAEGWDKFYWSLGACLFTHAATMISVSYFDQSVAFLYLTFAAISAVYLHACQTSHICASDTESEDAARMSSRSVNRRRGV